MIHVVYKVLSKNDLGLTGSHQAGILVPKKLARGEFFPLLNETVKNPRITISVSALNKKFEFQFIHYNSRCLGVGTRNEFRLTGLSSFYREADCKLGDTLKLSYDIQQEEYKVEVISSTEIEHDELLSLPLTIKAGWAFE